jgi:NDP-sugar pyrophosphorylase family protein
LKNVGFKKIILSIGYRGESISNYKWAQIFSDLEFEIIDEATPLGTGGAVRNVFSKTNSLQGAWVVNGDTLLENPLPPKRPGEDKVLYSALEPSRVFNAQPNLVIQDDRVVGVIDGQGQVFDGGQVFITRETVMSYDGGIPCSFHTLIEKSIKEKTVGFKICRGTCYDIGTPERLKRFEDYLLSRRS